MRQGKIKAVSFISAVAVAMGVCGNIIVSADDEELSLIKAEGWLESAYVTWNGYKGADTYNVYSKEENGDYIKLDDELVREYPDYFRADALGLSEGNYTLKVVPVKDGEEITDAAAETYTLTVMPHVREGFAFSDNSPIGTASGAYNNDGTLKADADILYVTNGNKDTVMLNNDSAYGVGLTQILAYRQAKKIKTALDIRLIGKVDEPAGMTIHTAQFQNTGNVTLEGVGDDATIFGWIMTLKRAENFEIRNIGMMYGGEGTTGSAIVLDTDNKNIWVHNMDFFYGAPGKDADQKKGDGAVDLKSRSDYVTISYNHFWDLGKTCVSGGPWENSNMYTDEAKIFVTYHHNWFDHTDSRHPRCVVGSNHVYNNYYDGNAMYGIGAAMKTSVFSEANYYRNCPRPMIIASQGGDMWNGTDYTGGDNKKGTLSGQMGGMIKSYGDVMITPSHFYAYGEEDVEGEFDAYVAQSRDEKVPETVQAKKGDEQGNGIYNNFDTDPDIMYDYNVDTAEEAVVKVKAYAGRVDGGDFKWTFNNDTDDSFHDIDENLLAEIKGYESSLVSVAGGKIEVEAPTAEPTATPDYTETESPSSSEVPPASDAGIKAMPYNTVSYAKDWFGGQAMSAGDISADGYVGCYKGSGNSYKTNNFNADGVTVARGYQTKGLSNRSFYILPQGECDVTIYFYSAARRIALYTTSDTVAAAEFTPETSGDMSYTYHYTETGYPIYITGPDGDIYIAGVKTGDGEAETEPATSAPSETTPPDVTIPPEETNPPQEAAVSALEFTLNDDGSAYAKVTNTTDKAVNISLISAVYDENGKLVDVKLTLKTMQSGETRELSTNGGEELQGKTIKAFVWDMDNLSAISNMLKSER